MTDNFSSDVMDLADYMMALRFGGSRWTHTQENTTDMHMSGGRVIDRCPVVVGSICITSTLKSCDMVLEVRYTEGFEAIRRSGASDDLEYVGNGGRTGYMRNAGSVVISKSGKFLDEDAVDEILASMKLPAGFQDIDYTALRMQKQRIEAYVDFN